MPKLNEDIYLIAALRTPNEKKLGLAALCISGAMGLSLLIERV
jgi:hypothetical protein